jgi:hypothetical protein
MLTETQSSNLHKRLSDATISIRSLIVAGLIELGCYKAAREDVKGFVEGDRVGYKMHDVIIFPNFEMIDGDEPTLVWRIENNTEECPLAHATANIDLAAQCFIESWVTTVLDARRARFKRLVEMDT